MVNNKEGMLTCDNKMSFLSFEEIVSLHLNINYLKMRKV